MNISSTMCTCDLYIGVMLSSHSYHAEYQLPCVYAVRVDIKTGSYDAHAIAEFSGLRESLRRAPYEDPCVVPALLTPPPLT